MLLRHTVLYMVARVVPGLLSFLAVVVYTRMVDPDDYGRYALLLAVIQPLQMTLFQWLRSGLVRFLPQAQTEGKEAVLISTVSVGFGAVSLLSAIVWSLAVRLLPLSPAHKTIFSVGLLLFLSQGLYESVAELRRATFAVASYTFFSLVRSVIALGLSTVLLVLWNGTVHAIIVGTSVASLVAAVGDFARLRANFEKVQVDWGMLRKLGRYGLPLVFTPVLGSVVTFADRFFLVRFASTDTVGLYSAGYDFARQSLGLVLSFIHLSIYPLIVRVLAEAGEAAARRYMAVSELLLVSLGLPAAIGLMLLSPDLSHLFGEAYVTTARYVIPWVSLATLLWAWNSLYVDMAFHLGQRVELQTLSLLIGAGVNLVLDFWLIPVYRIKGALYATVASYAVSLIVSILLSKRAFLLVYTPMVWLRALVGTCVMAVVVSAIPGSGWPTAVAKVAVGGVAYALTAWAVDLGQLRTKIIPDFVSRLGRKG